MNLKIALFRQVLQEPTNQEVKLVFADYLEEHGNPDLAFAYRWAAKHGKYPHIYTNGKCAGWAVEGTTSFSHGLPKKVFWISDTSRYVWTVNDAFRRLAAMLKNAGVKEEVA